MSEQQRIDFDEVKQVPILEVAKKLGIEVSGRGKWLYGRCPLPTHDAQKKNDKKFGINTDKNYWTCFSDSCKERRAGNEWGDAITLVSILEACGPRDAAERILRWFRLDLQEPPKNKAPSAEAQPSARDTNGKGYMKEVDVWFDELTERRNEERNADFWKRVRNGVKSRLLESYKNGRVSITNPSPCPVCAKPRVVSVACPDHE